MSDVNLGKLLLKMQGVAKKKQLESKDLEVLREIKDGISQALQVLKECDCCGAAVTEIARLELDGVRAAVCRDCGIKALKNKALILKKVKKNEARREKKEDKAPQEHKEPREPKEPKPHKKAPPPPPSPAAPKPSRLVEAMEKKEEPSVGQTMLPLSDKNGQTDKNTGIEEVASETAVKVPVVRKLFEIASSVAFPMALERTISYARMEAVSQGLKLTDEELRRVITGLVKKAGLKVKD
jgi:sRNA-binding protein